MLVLNTSQIRQFEFGPSIADFRASTPNGTSNLRRWSAQWVNAHQTESVDAVRTAPRPEQKQAPICFDKCLRAFFVRFCTNKKQRAGDSNGVHIIFQTRCYPTNLNKRMPNRILDIAYLGAKNISSRILAKRSACSKAIPHNLDAHFRINF